MVFGRTAMSRRLLFRYILIFSSFFAEIRPVLPSISEKHPWPAMVIPTSYFDPTALRRLILLPTLHIHPTGTEIPGNSSPKQIREARRRERH
ncbi:hypothetical protein C8J57DRAFT_1371779, partial [Mycena rebaudengoi]